MGKISRRWKPRSSRQKFSRILSLDYSGDFHIQNTMRLWSLHPRHLDQKALVACWREGLLAYHVLRWLTKWYKNHPQLIRFKSTSDPIVSLEAYLHGICDEADARGYKFDRTKLGSAPSDMQKIPLTRGQLAYETEHLERKIRERAPKELSRIVWKVIPHTIFNLIDGKVEDWERV